MTTGQNVFNTVDSYLKILKTYVKNLVNHVYPVAPLKETQGSQGAAAPRLRATYLNK